MTKGPVELRRAHRLTDYRTLEFPFLLSTGMLGSMTSEAIERWLLNFREVPDAEYYAAKILANTLYYPETFIKRIYRKAFFEMLVWPRLKHGKTDHSFEDEGRFRRETQKFLNGTIVVPLLDEGKPTESANAVARLIKQEGIVSTDNVCFPRDLLDYLPKAHTVVIVDDHVGSGEQVRDFWRNERSFDGKTNPFSFHDLAQQHPNVSFNFIVYAGVKKSLDSLRAGLPEVEIICPELLDDRHRVFSNESEIWRDSDELSNARETLRQVCEPAGVPLAGWKELDFAYASQLGTPDWSIPILNWKGNGWIPLLT